MKSTQTSTGTARSRVNRVCGPVLALVVAMFSLGLAFIVWRYLADYSSRTAIAALTLVVGCAVAVLLAVGIGRARSRKWGIAAGVASLALLGVLPVSCMIGRVMYSRFGLTVYGIMPIPALDITVDSHGVLWFRNKAHLITADEVERLAADGVEVVVIGNGWDRVARVEDRVFELKNVTIRVYSTPEAFDEYNRLKSSGTKVALLAHTTC